MIDDKASKVALVAGATGYLGSRVVKTFAERGIRVRALVRPGRRVEGAHDHFEAEATQPATLRGACNGVSWVFSALGITRQRDRGVTYDDVDYGANLSLLREAERAGVARYGVVSVVDGARFRGNPMIDAKQRFIAALRSSSVPGSVVCATGFFSDMTEFLEMAHKGPVFLFGDGGTSINPVDGLDVASAAAEALERGAQEIAVGGPDVLTWNEIADLARAALHKSPRKVHVPIGLVRAGLPVARLFGSKSATTVDFILRVAARDLVAPTIGKRHLRDFYQTLAQGETRALADAESA